METNFEEKNGAIAAQQEEYRPALALCEDGTVEPGSLAEGIREVLDRRNAGDPAVLRLEGRTDLCEYLVIATATSATHLRALADEVEYRLGLCGVKALSRDGKGDGQKWIVLDYGFVMVHIFTSDERERYSLERLFPNALRVTPGEAGNQN